MFYCNLDMPLIMSPHSIAILCIILTSLTFQIQQVSLGKDKFNDRKNYVEDVKDVDLYKMIPFNCELPGTSQLHISLMDWDLIGTLGFVFYCDAVLVCYCAFVFC